MINSKAGHMGLTYRIDALYPLWMRKINEVLQNPERLESLVSRFWPKVDVSGGENACWPWVSKAKHGFGYGRISSGRKAGLKSHQVSWVLSNGELPDGACVLHECDNPSCCNPKHLFLGTMEDNTQDMIAKGRWSPPPISVGEAHPRTKFSDDQVAAIIADTRDALTISKEYGTSRKTIYTYKRNGGR